MRELLKKIEVYGVYVFTLLLVLLLLTVAGCKKDVDKSDSQPSSTKTTTITDMAGRTVQVPQQVNKVVGMGAGGLRFIVYLDAADKVVAVEDSEKQVLKTPYRFAHTEFADLPSIGKAAQGDAELLMAQQPDVIIWNLASNGEVKPIEDLQEKTGIPVVVIQSHLTLSKSKDKIFECIRLTGNVLDKKDRAEKLIKDIDTVIKDLHRRTENIPEETKPKVYVGGMGYRGAQGILSTSGSYSSFSLIKAHNVAREIGKEHAFIDKEAILKWDPDIIFLEAFGYDLSIEDLSKPEYQSLKACKSKNIYRVLPNNYYGVSFATELVNAYFIGSVLYPDQFKDVNIEMKANEIYEMFVGNPVYDDMKKEWGELQKVK